MHIQRDRVSHLFLLRHMYLQKLAIQGFKSFANKTALEFNPGVTAIVGPNGSGKSNIADAVRWVLGEQSLKSLRGKKSGDVIFAGSDKKTRLGYCQVDLYLNNDDRTAPVDYSEIVISRKIYRDGEGEYYINKNKVRLQDILMLLAKSSFGQRSYSIIGQGMIDLFLGATPSTRKEFFDEAAGVRQFQIKKEQAENKLSQTRENLAQAGMLIQEIEPRLRSLTRQVNRLEKREEVSKQLKELQHQYYGGLWHDLKQKHLIEEKRYQTTEHERQEKEEQTEALQREMQQLALGQTRQEEFQKLQQEYSRLSAEKNKLLQDQAVLRGRKDADRTQHGEFDLVWLERKYDQLQQEQTNMKQAITPIEQAVSSYEQELAQKQQAHDELATRYETLDKELDQARRTLAKKKTITIPEISQRIESIYTQQQSVLELIEQAQQPDDLQQIKAEAKTLASSMAQLRHQLHESGTGDPHEVIKIQDAISELLDNKSTLVTAINSINSHLTISRERQQMMSKRLQEIERELHSLQDEIEQTRGKKSASAVAEDIDREEEELKKNIAGLDKQLTTINHQLTEFNQAEQKKKEEIFDLQNKYARAQDELNNTSNKLNNIKVELAKLETRQEDLEKEMIDEMTDEERQAVYTLEDPPVAEQSLFTEIQKLKRQLELIGGIDPQVADEYKETKERHDFLTSQSADLTQAAADLEQAIASLEDTIKKQFNQAFDQINKKFTEYFKILFNGGNAHLSLVKEEKKALAVEDEEDEDEDEEVDADKKAEQKQPSGTGEKVITGIDIHATPPGKKLRGIAMLSGGERALTSIALICAIIHHNPSPFVVLDEVDAALDESNSIRFATIIEKLSHKTQFIVITHNRATMDKAKILYGVTMGDDGVSKLLSLNMAEAEQVIEGNS